MLPRHGLSVRGDSLYCPLSFSLDSYWNCLNNCFHCYLRKLNRTWGEDLRPTDALFLRKTLLNGLKNTNPKSNLAQCLRQKKTIRWGNKSDPFQKCERKYRVSKKILQVLIRIEWTFVIQTMDTEVMMEYESLILQANSLHLVVVCPIVSPGLEKDWEILERKRTNNPIERLQHVQYLKDHGVPCGINGEPFIPGFHTIKNFEDTLKLLKHYGINRYNTYNLHFNDLVAKRLHKIGLDIEKIWFMNQDSQWKKILQKLLDLAKKYNIILGCPDFVNSGPDWREKANTCCGIDVPNPTTFNSHFFKKQIKQGIPPNLILKNCWDGIGDFKEGKDLLFGTNSKMYNMKDAGMI